MNNTVVSRPPECLSDFVIDRWILQELNPAERFRSETHVDLCTSCKKRFLEFEREYNAFLASFAAMRQVSEQPVKSERPRYFEWIAGALAFAGALMAGVWVTIRVPDEERLKGSSGFRFWVLHDGKVRIGSDGEVVHPQDALRFEIHTGKPQFVAILSLDSEQRATVFYPPQVKFAVRTEGTPEVLPLSTVLDETLGTEMIMMVSCNRVFEPAVLRVRLEREGEALLSERDCRVAKAYIQKVMP